MCGEVKEDEKLLFDGRKEEGAEWKNEELSDNQKGCGE